MKRSRAKRKQNIDQGTIEIKTDGVLRQHAVDVHTGRMDDPSTAQRPMSVFRYGITYPMPKYSVKRETSRIFVLEYVLSGSGYILLNDTRHEVGAGDAYLLEPGSSHEYGTYADDPYTKYWVNFRSSIFLEIAHQYGLDGRVVFRNVDLRKQFERLFDLSKVSSLNDDIYHEASAIIFEMFMLLAKSARKAQVIPPAIARARDLLDFAIESKFDIDELTRMLFISKSQLMRGFKRYYGISPYQYLLSQKIERAKEQLLSSDMSIREISDVLHFANEHHFSNYFKEQVGMSPRAFRKEHRSSPQEL